MGRIMQTLTGQGAWQQPLHLKDVGSVKSCDINPSGVSFDEALKEEMIDVEQVEHFDGVPHVRVTNNSSWKILLFSGEEMIGRQHDRFLSITVTLQHNGSVVIPAFFLASTYFFDQGMSSIQQCLHHFKALDNQVGIVFKGNNKVIGERYGEFPLLVEVCLDQYGNNYFATSQSH